MTDLPQYLNIIGLILDIIGVFMLFKFGLPSEVSKKGHQLLIIDTDEKEILKAKKYEYLSYTALGLLLSGFTFQITANCLQI